MSRLRTRGSQRILNRLPGNGLSLRRGPFFFSINVPAMPPTICNSTVSDEGFNSHDQRVVKIQQRFDREFLPRYGKLWRILIEQRCSQKVPQGTTFSTEIQSKERTILTMCQDNGCDDRGCALPILDVDIYSEKENGPGSFQGQLNDRNFTAPSNNQDNSLLARVASPLSVDMRSDSVRLFTFVDDDEVATTPKPCSNLLKPSITNVPDDSVSSDVYQSISKEKVQHDEMDSSSSLVIQFDISHVLETTPTTKEKLDENIFTETFAPNFSPMEDKPRLVQSPIDFRDHIGDTKDMITSDMAIKHLIVVHTNNGSDTQLLEHDDDSIRILHARTQQKAYDCWEENDVSTVECGYEGADLVDTYTEALERQKVQSAMKEIFDVDEISNEGTVSEIGSISDTSFQSPEEVSNAEFDDRRRYSENVIDGLKQPSPIYVSDNLTPYKKTSRSSNDGLTFTKMREKLTVRYFEEFNESAFQGQLSSVKVEWSNKLRTTAGLTRLQRRHSDFTPGVPPTRFATIELSVKVLDDAERLRSTLLHEMVHAAAWILDGVSKPPHGPHFKKWAALAMSRISGVEVTTTHDYKIQYKYIWVCTTPGCTFFVQRHSRSVDTQRQCCGRCRGRLIEVESSDRLSHTSLVRTTPKLRAPLSGFNIFIKECSKSVRERLQEERQGKISQIEVMKECARLWNEQKQQNRAQG